MDAQDIIGLAVAVPLLTYCMVRAIICAIDLYKLRDKG